MRHRVYYSLEGEDGERDAFVFEVDDQQYRQVAANLSSKQLDLDQALDKAVAMLSANVRLNDKDIDSDVLAAQMAATATVWFLFNEAADEEDRINGDVLLVEKDGELFVTDMMVEDTGEDDEEG